MGFEPQRAVPIRAARTAQPPHVSMQAADGLVAAYLMDGKGGGRSLDWQGVRRWLPEHGTIWVHLDRMDHNAQRWLRQESGLDPMVCDALLTEGTSPRFTISEHGVVTPESFLLVLRGVNYNPGDIPEELVSLRIWADRHRVISLGHRVESAVADIRAHATQNLLPEGPGDLIAELIEHLTDHIEEVVERLADRTDELEDQSLSMEAGDLRRRISAARREMIVMRRYLAPQREVIRQLRRDGPPWLSEQHGARLREAGEETARLVEDLDAARERATVAQEELTSRLSEQLNHRIYVFTIIAAIFLPLTLLTGLLGINVAGIPGAGDDAAFAVVTVLLIGLGALEVLLLRRLGLF